MTLYHTIINGMSYYALQPFFIGNPNENQDFKILAGNPHRFDFWLNSVHGIGQFDGTFEEGLEWLLS